MAIEVEILNIEETSNSIDIAVSVQTEGVETIDYVLNVNDTGTGGNTDISGTLVGGAGSFPGDANIEDVSFGKGDTSGGLVTAIITSPAEYEGVQDQQEWGEQESGPGEITVTDCGAEQVGGDLRVEYTLAPSGSTGGDVTVGVVVDGRSVSTESHFVPGRGGSFTQTVPASSIPTGENMPVEIQVG